MKDQINTIRAALESCNPGDWSSSHVIHPSYDDAAVEKALTALSDLEAHLAQYEAGDVASAAAQGFRDGVASVAQQPQYDQTALELCAVCGWKTLIPGDCCLNCERNKAQQPQANEMVCREVERGGDYIKYAVTIPNSKHPQAEPQDVGQLEYRGNSVAYIHQKMTAYRSAIDAAWEAMRDAGHPPDGRTPLAQAITKALAPQQAEAVPSDVTDAMALAFHRALTDGSISQSEVEEIKVGLRAALAHQQAEAVPSIDALEQEIYENTREFVPRSVMDWMLQRYYPAAPQQAEAAEAVNETNAVIASRYFDLLRVVEQYEKNGVTCQTYRHFVTESCAECNSPGRCAKQAEAVPINYSPLYEFADKNRVSYNELCAAVRAALAQQKGQP